MIGDENSGGNTSPVSMDDLMKLETSLTSSMDAQLKELREMMMQLLNGSKPSPPDLHLMRLMLPPHKARRVKEPIKIPHLKLLMGRRCTMRFPMCTPPTHLSLILI